MAELLFEILSEEIPARMQVRAGQDLSKAITSGLEKAGLTVEAARIFTGPRRLTYVADVPLRSPDISEERKGPRVGSPERALEGFMKRQACRIFQRPKFARIQKKVSSMLQ